MVILSDEQNAAVTLMCTGANVLLLGSAGTGKSAVTEAFVQVSRDAGKRVAVTAPTASAAFLIGGCTLHSLLAPLLPYQTLEELSKSLPGWLTGVVANDLSANSRNVKRRTRSTFLQSLDVLCLDEVSLLRPDLLYILHAVAQTVRKNQRPFGGIQIVLVGDTHQLPPVPLPDTLAQLKSRASITTRYFVSLWHPTLPSAYELGDFQTATLSRIYRQIGDNTFLSILALARAAKPFSEWPDALREAFKARVGAAAPQGSAVARLRVTNAAVDEINTRELAALPGNMRSYLPCFTVGVGANKIAHAAMTLTDEHKTLYKLTPLLETILETQLAELRPVVLKVGATCMISHNVPGKPHLFRGLLGKVLEMSPVSVRIEFEHGTEVITFVEITHPSAGGYIITKFMPLRLGYAITVHKAQGCSISRAEIEFTQKMMPGSAYTALSRLRSLDGLTVVVANMKVLDTCFVTSGLVARLEGLKRKR